MALKAVVAYTKILLEGFFFLLRWFESDLIAQFDVASKLQSFTTSNGGLRSTV